MNTNNLILVILTVAVLSSCVPNRQYIDLKTEKLQVETENVSLRENNESLSSKWNETEAENTLLSEQKAGLESDTTILGNSLRHMTDKYDKINQLNEILTEKSTSLLQESIDENKALLAELDKTREELLEKEDELNILAADLNSKEESLNKISAELNEKAERVTELESLLEEQRAAVTALREKVSRALLNFEGKGLTIEERNGKLYVSLEANLLFPSGSTVISEEGKKALIELALAIQGQSDLEIIVEGHTDTDKMNSPNIPRDNWELSVLRATSVVKIMTENSSLDPKILSASGKSEYVPKDASDKSKNRRIEIVLSPNLDELFEIIGG